MDGEPLAISTGLCYLAKAVALGFRHFTQFGPGRPIPAKDGERWVLWVVLGAESALKPTADAICISVAAALNVTVCRIDGLAQGQSDSMP